MTGLQHLKRTLLVTGLSVSAIIMTACAPEPGSGGNFSAPPLSISSPQVLMGATEAKVTALLGQPRLLRREPPAQVWQYLGQACVLDFYFSEESGQSTVRYIEARSRSGVKTASDGCLRDVHQSRYRPSPTPSV